MNENNHPTGNNSNLHGSIRGNMPSQFPTLKSAIEKKSEFQNFHEYFNNLTIQELIELLHLAIRVGHDEAFDVILGHQNDLIDAKYGTPPISPIHRALEKKRSKMALSLIEKGCNIFELDGMKRSVLRMAIAGGPSFTQIILKLLAKDHPLDDMGSDTPIVHQMLEGEEFAQNDRATRVILYAMLERGLPVDTVKNCEGGVTLLHTSCATMCSPVVDVLLEFDASVDQSDSRGWTALHYAASSGRDRIITKLIKSGASPDISSFTAATPLHVAVEFAFDPRSCIAILLNAGADLWSTTTSLDTPLHLACCNKTHREGENTF
jgi:ankyrin repeat protein